MLRSRLLLLTFLWIASHAHTQVNEPDWEAVEEETLEHFRALLRFDTSDPPGRELPAAEYLRDVLRAEGIQVEMLSVDPDRPNVVARLEGDGSGLTGVSQDIDTLSNYGAQTIHQTDDHFLISDDGTEKKITFSDLEDSIFTNVSGEATIAGGGALTIAANVIGNNELKQDDDITLQALTTTNNLSVGGNATITGDLTVNGTTTTIATTNTEVADQFLFLASGSAGSNLDSGIIVQSGSAHNSGSAFYHDKSDERWAVSKGIAHSRTEATTPTQFVTTVKSSTSTPGSSDGDFGVGEMWVDTDAAEPTGDGVIYIRTG